MTVDLEYTAVFQRTREAFYDPSVRFILHQGGTRSSKTWSICQFMIVDCLTNPGRTWGVYRKHLADLKAEGQVIDNFLEIMKELGLYDETMHNKSRNSYVFSNGSKVQFAGASQEQKLRGSKRDVLWVNEANELWDEDFKQLNFRTKHKCIFDFNPSFQGGYLVELENRPNFIKIKSTFRDNPFLSPEIIEEIEFLKHADPDSYKIYNLGERAPTKEHVFRHWKVAPKPPELDQVAYGLDFGWSHPTALIRVWHDGSGKRFHWEQVVHRGMIQVEELAAIMETEVGYEADVIADSSDPGAIAYLNELGFAVHKADKDSGSVKKGFSVLRTSILTIDPASAETIKDFENYRYKKVRGIITEEVHKVWDDAPDAGRYCCVFLREMSGGMSFTMMR